MYSSRIPPPPPVPQETRQAGKSGRMLAMQWAVQHGHVRVIKHPVTKEDVVDPSSPDLWQVRAAEMLHGWKGDEEMSEAEYMEAIEAAKKVEMR